MKLKVSPSPAAVASAVAVAGGVVALAGVFLLAGLAITLIVGGLLAAAVALLVDVG